MTEPPALEHSDDIGRLDGHLVIARGVYRARPVPIKGVDGTGRPQDHALLELAGGSKVWLEPLDTDRSIRPAEELRRCADRRVRVAGTLHAVMPARGQSILSPCIANVSDVELEPSP